MEDLLFHRLRLVYFVLISFLTTLTSATFASMNIEEMNSISYHVDIMNNPILNAQDSSNDLVMHMTSKYGQQYECVLPNIANLLHDEHNLNRLLHGDPSSSSSSDISLLLKPLETSPCLIKTKDWWTYEFCYGKHIKQYHLEDNKIASPIIVLGLYDSEYNWQNESKADESSRNRLQRYHSQYYVNGSTCEVTGTQRRSEVRFLCEDGAGDYIAYVDEPESCRYVMTIHTTKVCHHPFLRPPLNNKPHAIVCNPILTSDQYTLFLKREEEEKKAVEKRRKEWLAKQEEQLVALKQLKEEAVLEREKEKAESKQLEISTDGNEKEAVQENSQRNVNEGERLELDIMKEQWESLREDLKTVIRKLKRSSQQSSDNEGEENSETEVLTEMTQFLKLLETQKQDTKSKLMKIVDDYIENANKFEEVVTQKMEMQMEPGTEEKDESSNDVEASSIPSKTRQKYSDLLDSVLNADKSEDENDDKENSVVEKDTTEKKTRQDLKKYSELLNSVLNMDKSEEENDDERVSDVEKAVAEKLSKELGIDTRGRKVEVKIITAGYFDDDDEFRSTDDDDSSQFQTVLIKLMNEDTSEHLHHQSMLEKNYRFVWNDNEGEKTEGEEDDDEESN